MTIDYELLFNQFPVTTVDSGTDILNNNPRYEQLEMSDGVIPLLVRKEVVWIARSETLR